MIASVICLFLMLNLLAVATAQGNGSTCPLQRLSLVLQTNEYILYGLTAECHLFFATSVPSDIDIGKEFGSKSCPTRYGRDLSCRSARLFSMKNADQKMKLLLIFATGPQIYGQVFDFKAPDRDMWYSKITGPDGGPIVSQCNPETICSYTNFTPLIDQAAQREGDFFFKF